MPYMKMLAAIITLFLALSFCSYSAVCQTQEEDSLNGYALHVTYHDFTIFFVPMYGPKHEGGGGFTTLKSLVNKRVAKDSERVSYIDVVTILQGDLWRVTVSVKFGEYFDQGKKQIATYQIREGEKVKIKELAQYGIEPLDVSVIKIERALAVQPAVINRTSSIVVVKVKAGALPLPYRLVLKNTSDKDVDALEIVTSNGRGESSLKWPEGTWDRPLIKAGQDYKIEMPSEKEYKSLPASAYLAEQLPIIEINTVVFTDGTYEGKPNLAVWQRAAALGNKLQLDRVLLLIQNALDTVDADSALEQFKDAVSSLDEIAKPESIEEFKSQFPNLSEDQKTTVLNIMRRKLHDIKFGLNQGIADFERESRQTVSSSFKDWLEKRKEMYERWRSKLQ